MMGELCFYFDFPKSFLSKILTFATAFPIFNM